MAIANRYVVLYFVRGPVPSTEQLAEAREYGPHVMFRNVLYIRDGDGLEPCTAVAGDYPKAYLRRYPRAVSYAEWIAGKLPAVAAPKPAAPIAAPAEPDTPARPRRSRAAAPAEAMEPLSDLSGTEGAPPPPPPPLASTTGAITLPPPPPQG